MNIQHHTAKWNSLNQDTSQHGIGSWSWYRHRYLSPLPWPAPTCANNPKISLFFFFNPRDMTFDPYPAVVLFIPNTTWVELIHDPWHQHLHLSPKVLWQKRYPVRCLYRSPIIPSSTIIIPPKRPLREISKRPLSPARVHKWNVFFWSKCPLIESTKNDLVYTI